MAFGNYNNNKQNSVFDPTVYSPYRMNNGESKVDKTCITFTYWKNVLRITISPRKETNNDEMQFDLENGISIYLSHTKARILAQELRNFMSDPVKYDSVGVPSGQGLITISRGTEYNSPSPVLIIRKIDADGKVTSSFAYQFKTNYYFSVRNYKENGGFDKATEDYTNLEIEQMITLLEEYYRAMTCATAYTVMDQMKFESSRTSGRLNKIAEKLGIEYQSSSSGNNSRGNYNSTSYFNRSGSSSESSTPSAASGYTPATLDDID